MRNTDTTKQYEGLRPSTPAAHQRSVTVTLTREELDAVYKAIVMERAAMQKIARDAQTDFLRDSAKAQIEIFDRIKTTLVREMNC